MSIQHAGRLLTIVLLLTMPRMLEAQGGNATSLIESWWNMEDTQRGFALLYAAERGGAAPQSHRSGFGMEIRQSIQRWTITLRGVMVPTPTDQGSETNASTGLEWIPMQYRRLALGINSHVGLTNVMALEGVPTGVEFGYGASAYLLLSDGIATGASLSRVHYNTWGDRTQMLIRLIFF